MSNLFISYARVDEIRVIDLVEIIRLGGFEPWWDDKLEFGDDWKKTLAQRITACDGFVCVISPDSVASQWCQWELALASELGKPVIPVRVREGAILPPELAHLHYLDVSIGFQAADAARLIGKLARLKQHVVVDEKLLHQMPHGLPARLKRPLPKEYRTLAQAYFQPFDPLIPLYQWRLDRREYKQQVQRVIPGIDFGTTESSIAISDNGGVRLIPNQYGETSTPSAVAIASGGLPLVGVEAVELLLERPERGVLEVKRLLGIDAGNDPDVLVIDNIAYTAVQLAGFLLRQLRLDAEVDLKATISAVVLAAPAYFGPDQFAALTDAAKLAGLDVIRIIPEPVAACMAVAYENGCRSSGDETWMTYDLGGGTFDASVIDFCPVDDEFQFEVLAVTGDVHLGGADYDRVLVDYCLEEFLSHTGISLHNNLPALMKIRRSVERAKIALSGTTQASVRVSAIAVSDTGSLDMIVPLSQQLCTELTQHLSAETFRLIRSVANDAGKSLASVDNVLVVGRAARAAGIALGLQDLFSQRLHYALDNVVALGAATQGGVLSGQKKNTLLLELTTRTLRLEVMGGRATPLLPRNHLIPWRCQVEFAAPQDGKHPTMIRLYAGESSWAARNTLLAEVLILPSRIGSPLWILELSIDADSTVDVSIRANDIGVVRNVQFGLRQTRAQRPSAAERAVSIGATLPRLEHCPELSPVPHDICTDRIALRRWLALNAAVLVLDNVVGENRGYVWLSAGKEWLELHPSEDVPPDLADETIFNNLRIERELLVDHLEQCLHIDLQVARPYSSIKSLAEAIAILWHKDQKLIDSEPRTP